MKNQRGNPYGNAVEESFLKTLKAEEVYNWERLYSPLSNKSSDEYEILFMPNNRPNPFLTLLT